MQKIRINDLARELEVKSKAILDVLPLVGVTEKKTHSSSIEVDEAERVRAHFHAQESQTAGSARSSRARSEEPDAIKTKIDLSHISKPGDVLKLITQKQQAAAPPVKRPAPPAPVAPPAESKPAAMPPAAVQPPAAPPKPAAPAPPPPAAAPVAQPPA